MSFFSPSENNTANSNHISNNIFNQRKITSDLINEINLLLDDCDINLLEIIKCLIILQAR